MVQTVIGPMGSDSRHLVNRGSSSGGRKLRTLRSGFGSLTLMHGLRSISSFSSASCMTCLSLTWIRRISASVNLPVEIASAYARLISSGLSAPRGMSPNSSRIWRTSYSSLWKERGEPKELSRSRWKSSAYPETVVGMSPAGS